MILPKVGNDIHIIKIHFRGGGWFCLYFCGKQHPSLDPINFLSRNNQKKIRFWLWIYLSSSNVQYFFWKYSTVVASSEYVMFVFSWNSLKTYGPTCFNLVIKRMILEKNLWHRHNLQWLCKSVIHHFLSKQSCQPDFFVFLEKSCWPKITIGWEPRGNSFVKLCRLHFSLLTKPNQTYKWKQRKQSA